MAGLVTLITDASFHPDSGAAGWGAWCKRDGHQSSTWSGPVLDVTQPNEAELVATLEGFKQVRYLWPDVAVLLQSDCQRALMLLRWRFRFGESCAAGGMHVALKHNMRPTPREDQILADWASAWAHSGTVIVRHVKGHVTGAAGSAGRFYVNNLVDRLARSAMRSQRAGVRDERPEAGADR